MGKVTTSVSVGSKKDVDLAVDVAKKVREVMNGRYIHLLLISIYHLGIQTTWGITLSRSCARKGDSQAR